MRGQVSLSRSHDAIVVGAEKEYAGGVGRHRQIAEREIPANQKQRRGHHGHMNKANFRSTRSHHRFPRHFFRVKVTPEPRRPDPPRRERQSARLGLDELRVSDPQR